MSGKGYLCRKFAELNEGEEEIYMSGDRYLCKKEFAELNERDKEIYMSVKGYLRRKIASSHEKEGKGESQGHIYFHVVSSR